MPATAGSKAGVRALQRRVQRADFVQPAAHHHGIIYAVLVRRRRPVGWHVTIPGVGSTTASVRRRTETAALTLITAVTGEQDAQLVILPRRPGGPPPA